MQGAALGGGLYQPPLEGPQLYELGRGVGMMAAGAAEFIGGGGIATGGTAACVTGVGCFGGAPATALGVAVAANGATSVAAGNRVVQNALNKNNSFATGRGYGSTNAKRGAGGVGDPKAKGGVYALKDKDTGKVMRTGKAIDLGQRRLDHMRDPRYSHLVFEPLYRTDEFMEQMGLERMVHDLYDPPYNYKLPLSEDNPLFQQHMDAARAFLNAWGLE